MKASVPGRSVNLSLALLWGDVARQVRITDTVWARALAHGSIEMRPSSSRLFSNAVKVVESIVPLSAASIASFCSLSATIVWTEWEDRVNKHGACTDRGRLVLTGCYMTAELSIPDCLWRNLRVWEHHCGYENITAGMRTSLRVWEHHCGYENITAGMRTSLRVWEHQPDTLIDMTKLEFPVTMTSHTVGSAYFRDAIVVNYDDVMDLWTQ